jgi:hypothetical protein
MVVTALPTRTSTFSLRSTLIDAVQRLKLDMSEFIVLLAEFDLSGEWAFDNARSCAHWVAERADTEVCTAREWLRIAHALSAVDEIARRFADGQLSYSKVRTLTRVADADNQHELCAIAERVSAGHLHAALAAWLARTETPEEREQRQRAQTKFGWRTEADGMIAGWFRFPPETGGVLTSAVDTQVMRAKRGEDAPADASTSPSVTKWPTLTQQRADALITVISDGGANVTTEVVLHVRGDGCTLDDGTPIADSVVERLVPDAFIRVLIHDAERQPINASSRQRHPTQRQKRVVKERDRVCVDCGSTKLLTYDHEPDYEQSRHTIVEELKLRCAPCHHKRHAKQEAEGTSG